MAVTRDDAGNVQVDFVWGNFPLQPDADRGENTLDPTLDNHSIATTGYANFPQFLPNYAGDGDTGFETIIPDLRGLFWPAAQLAAAEAQITLAVEWATPVVISAAGSAKNLVVVLESADQFVAGDKVSLYLSDGTNNLTLVDAKITDVNGATLTLKLKSSLAEAIEWTTTNSYLYDNYTGSDTRYVLWQNHVAGGVYDAGTEVLVRVLQNND